MSDLLEDQLRELFAEDGERAPVVGRVARVIQRDVRRRRRIRVIVGCGTAATVGVVAKVVLTVDPGEAPTKRAEQPAESPSPNAQPSPVPGGPVVAGNAASCIIYSAENAMAGALVFDGTVNSFVSSGRYRTALLVSLRVNEWFKGGSDSNVTVVIPVGPSIDPGAPPFEEGTRLLVVAGDRGARSDDPIAWGCDFTSYYAESKAEAWRRAALQ